MRYIYLIALANFLAMPTVSTPADEPTADQRLKADREHDGRGLKADREHDGQGLPKICRASKGRCQPIAAGVFKEFGLAQFRLRSGRLQLDPMRYRKGSQEHRTDTFHESITVSSSSGVPSVYYRYEDGDQRIQLTAEHGGTLRIDSTIVATGERATLLQPAGGELVWSTQRDPESGSELDAQHRGQTLLHVIGQDEAGFTIHLNTLITRMLRGRSPIDLARQTEAFLLSNADRLSSVSATRVDELIDQLRSAKSAKRRAAMNQLTRLGISAIPHLQQSLKRADLETEQRLRIRSLVARCPRVDDDTPSSLACLLSTDREHWQLIAGRMSQTQWVAANDHIRRCGLETLTR